MNFKIKFITIIILLLFSNNISYSAEPVVISDPAIFSGIEIETFKNGVSPSPEYDGLRLASINWSNPTTNYYAEAGDTLCTLGYSYRGLFKIDLDALPDSAIINRATLWILARTSDYEDVDDTGWIGVYRLFAEDLNFDEVTWNNSSADSTWLTPGAADSLYRLPGAFGSSGTGQNTTSNINSMTTGLSQVRPEIAGYPIGFGADSVSVLSTNTYSADRMMFPSDISDITFGTVNPYWARVDITHSVQNWHNGTWPNYGAMLSIFQVTLDNPDSVPVDINDVALDGFFIEFPNTKANQQVAPFVVIEYVWGTVAQEEEEEEGGGGSGGNSIGGIRQGPR